MNAPTVPPPAIPASLKDVVDRLMTNPDLSDTRKRDLRSAVVIYGKLKGEALSAIPLDLAAIRHTLHGIVPAQAKVSRKRWANLRSDLAAALDASGLQPMLKTSGIELDCAWAAILGAVKDKAVTNGLSRLGHWATLREIGPAEVDDAILEWFFSDLEAASLVRNLRGQRRSVAKSWNRLATLAADHALQRVKVPSNRPVSTRVPWPELPASFRDEVEEYLVWCSVPDPLDHEARARALAPETLRLRRDHIHLAASAACASGIDAKHLTSLADLVEPETFRAVLRHLWQKNGNKFST
jgi:hypothetical protein